CTELPSWPVRVYGEAPWRDGGTLAWGYDDGHHVVGLRSRAGATCHVERVPFWTWNVVIPDTQAPLWPTHNDGLWEWLPGRGGERVMAMLSCLGARLVDDGGIRGEPSFRFDGPRYLVERRGQASVFKPQTRQLIAEPLPPEGPCWSASRGQ